MIGKEAQLPLVAVLPLTDPRLMRGARDIASIGQGLLLLQDSPLLAVSLAADVPARVILWDQRLVPCPDRARELGDRLFCLPALTALRTAADALADRLVRWGWIGAADPDLHAVTDGTGLVLAAASIGDLYGGGDCGWLLDLARPAGNATPVLPMADDGIWGLLTAENASLH